MTLLLALVLLWGQSGERGEGFVLSGLPAGSFSGEVRVQRTAEGVSLSSSEYKKEVTLSFWPLTEGRGMWHISGYSRPRPDGIVQRLELRNAQTHLIFLDNVERGADLVAGWTLERLDEEAVYLSANGERVRLERNTPTPLSSNWCATLLGVFLPPEPSQTYAEEVTEAKADLLIAPCQLDETSHLD